MRVISDFDWSGKKVFLRLDLNVPMEGGQITDDNRLQEALPTLNYLLEHRALICVSSHLGRPKGKVDPQLSLEPVAKKISELANIDVMLIEDPSSEAPRGLLPTLKRNQVLMLENLRFDPREEQNAESLAAQFVKYTDFYVNDAFGASHRAHASVSALPMMMGEKKCAGFLIAKEVAALKSLLQESQRPFVCVLGGAKVSDKIDLIDNLSHLVDVFVIGGAMATTFLAAQGVEVGDSRIEKEKVKTASKLLEKLIAKEKSVLLPVDHCIAKSLDGEAVFSERIPQGWCSFDIGRKTAQMFAQAIASARTVFWNGPMGVFERESFAEGTCIVAKALQGNHAAQKVIGGGDTAAAVRRYKLQEGIGHISTGGGASLEYLEGRKLPGLQALEF